MLPYLHTWYALLDHFNCNWLLCIGVNSIKSISTGVQNSRPNCKIAWMPQKMKKTWNFYGDFDLVDGFENIGTHHKFLFPAFSFAFALYFRNGCLFCVNVSLDFMNERCSWCSSFFSWLITNPNQWSYGYIYAYVKQTNGILVSWLLGWLDAWTQWNVTKM